MSQYLKQRLRRFKISERTIFVLRLAFPFIDIYSLLLENSMFHRVSAGISIGYFSNCFLSLIGCKKRVMGKNRAIGWGFKIIKTRGKKMNLSAKNPKAGFSLFWVKIF